MKKLIIALSLTSALAAAHAGAATVTIDCGAGTAYDLCKAGVNRWAKKTGNTVKFFESPNSSNDHLGIIQQQLAARSSDIDVYLLDIIWPGLLSGQLVDLKGKVPESELNQHFKGILDANVVNGKLVAIPWYTDAGLLYYRTDLLKKYGFSGAPKTWAELALMAKKIQDGEQKTNKTFVGFVFQGKNYEGLTCDALEWIVSFGGGTIVDTTGKVTVNNPRAAEALDTAASWVRSISPAGIATYSEEEARGDFQAGNAAFMRNWPYAYALGQDQASKVKGKIGVAALPAGPSGKPAAALGGWNLGVNGYSKNQAMAIDLIRYLTGPQEQKIRAIEGAYNPTIQSLYKDQAVLKANPFFGSLYNVFTSAVARPSGPTKGKYNQVSQAFSTAVSSVLNGQSNGQAAVARLSTDLARIKGRGW
ncbi:ABC transporter substrate-binding protein [Deinococcus hopiensis]|uniref:Trehalose/maltose transport system substrate-binding protein n=1 Tax=Deinococcus hopiensis KR-140 TaxID=695939 RepID=A0A1W1UL76_9DEIO|nr:ABC transporter substrate-binding protein [Deinococcus hopiensis]SMB81878.1 trehalose/maltose transport system substrate-binding protein [Deinococcus hopiensis KR-140]